MLKYAFGDIHGNRDALMKLFEKVERDAGGREYRIIMLGDYVDRGPDSRGVIEFLISNQVKRPQDIYLMGNHEEMFLDALREYSGGGHVDPYGGGAGNFFRNGGKATMDSYGFGSDLYEISIPQAHMQFLKTLHLHWEDSRRYYVHAGVMPEFPLDQQTKSVKLWVREQFLYWDEPFEKYIVHGHTPTSYDPRARVVNNPVILDNRCNLDTGGCFGGKHTVGVFDDSQDQPINILQM